MKTHKSTKLLESLPMTNSDTNPNLGLTLKGRYEGWDPNKGDLEGLQFERMNPESLKALTSIKMK